MASWRRGRGRRALNSGRDAGCEGGSIKMAFYPQMVRSRDERAPPSYVDSTHLISAASIFSTKVVASKRIIISRPQSPRRRADLGSSPPRPPSFRTVKKCAPPIRDRYETGRKRGRERERCDGEIAPQKAGGRAGGRGRRREAPLSHEGAIPQFSLDLGPKSVASRGEGIGV